MVSLFHLHMMFIGHMQGHRSPTPRWLFCGGGLAGALNEPPATFGLYTGMVSSRDVTNRLQCGSLPHWWGSPMDGERPQWMKWAQWRNKNSCSMGERGNFILNCQDCLWESRKKRLVGGGGTELREAVSGRKRACELGARALGYHRPWYTKRHHRLISLS